MNTLVTELVLVAFLNKKQKEMTPQKKVFFKRMFKQMRIYLEFKES